MLCLLGAVAGRATAAPFVRGNLVIYRVGNGVDDLSNTGNPVFLDEYTPAGIYVQSIALPTSPSGSNRRLIASGTATSEGLMARSSDGRYVILTGYDAAPGGGTSLASTTATSVPRVVGRISWLGDVETSTALTDFASSNNPRSATSDDGTRFWVSGGAGGARHATPVGATTSQQLSTTVTNLRQIAIFGGQLYVSTQSGSAVRIGTVGTGLPTTSGQTITNLPGYPTTGNPNGFHLADLTAAVTGVDTLYVADDTAGGGQIRKYCKVGSTWSAFGTIAAPEVRGLTASVVGTSVALFGTTGGSGQTGRGSLYAFTDSTGHGVNVSGTATVIATAAACTAFRGVALAPTVGSAGASPPTLTITSAVPLAHAIADPTNPTVAFVVGDPLFPPGSLTVAAVSDNAAVVPSSNLVFSGGAGASRELTLIPVGVGYATITLTVTNGNSESTQVSFAYAASAAADPATRFHGGATDGSTAIALDASYAFVADDEDQTLRLYARVASGLPVASFVMTPFLGLTDLDDSGVPREVDIEGSDVVANRIFWLGSQSNSSDSFNSRPNRNRLFGTDVTGSGAAATLSFVGRYDFLRNDVISWDQSNGHGKGNSYYGLAASAAAGQDPKTPAGYNIEGLTMAPGSTTTAYIGFRAPLVPPSNRTKALVVTVTNLASLAVSGAAQGSATFGPPIELDLGGRGIRSMQAGPGGVLIVAGSPGLVGPSPDDFRLFVWSGSPTDVPQLLSVDLTGLNPEGIVELPPAPWTATSAVRLLSDGGIYDYYGDGIPGKDLPVVNFRKSRTDTVTFGSIVPSPAPGRVADGTPPLLATKNGTDPAKVDLSWGASCGATANDYAVYEGALGSFASHLPAACSTLGASTFTATPGGANRYWLVVPLSPTEEGSYGLDSNGYEVPRSASPCRTVRNTTPCP